MKIIIRRRRYQSGLLDRYEWKLYYEGKSKPCPFNEGTAFTRSRCLKKAIKYVPMVGVTIE